MQRAAMTVFALLLATAASIASAAERKARIEVSELFCPSCPYIAAKAVKSIESVEILKGDYDQDAQKIVFVVTYDDAVTSAEDIAEAPMEFGYPGRVLDAAPASGS